MATDLVSDSAEIKNWCPCHTGIYINTKEKESELDIRKHTQRLQDKLLKNHNKSFRAETCLAFASVVEVWNFYNVFSWKITCWSSLEDWNTLNSSFVIVILLGIIFTMESPLKLMGIDFSGL